MGAGNSQNQPPSHPPAEKHTKSSENSGYTETRPAEVVKLPETRPAEVVKLPETRPAEVVKLPETRPAEVVKLPETRPAEVVKLPHNCEVLLKDADLLVDKSSTQKLYERLYAGVFLNQKRKKYWVENKSNANCFMLYARDLSITWSEDNRFWHWPYLKESDVFVDVAELHNVCWLEVHGKLEASMLSPGVLYEFAFVVMLKDPAYGWEVPVNLRLTFPDGSRQEHKENLMEKLRGQWIEIGVGEFMASQEKLGEIEFSLYDYEGGKWKKGLVIKGVAIRPKA